jgi:hypothetical protein
MPQVTVTPLTSYNMVAEDGLVTARPDVIIDDSAMPLPPAFPCPPRRSKRPLSSPQLHTVNNSDDTALLYTIIYRKHMTSTYHNRIKSFRRILSHQRISLSVYFILTIDI